MSDRRTILVADDDPDIREIIRILLESDGYNVREAADGDEAVRMIGDDVDLYILDVMMPGKNGWQVCREVRQTSMAPILFLTAKSQDSDKAMGFSAGADDYLAKPFSYTELTSRIKALLRRYYVYGGKEDGQGSETITLRDLTINKLTGEVKRGDELIQLTDTEFRMLALMAENRRKLFSAQELYESVWKEEYFYSCNNTIMVHMRNLRRKLEPDPDNPRYIKTVWGKGYRVE